MRGRDGDRVRGRGGQGEGGERDRVRGERGEEHLLRCQD